ncbi:MAG: porin [Steroidobacteraceae bacterium]|nr:porin [Steroidobacteraceae bacterium]
MPRHRLGRGASLAFISAFVFLLGNPVAQAQDLDSDRFTIRGFGTVGATTHDTDGIEYRRNTGQARGAESGELDLKTDSLAGLQLDMRLGPKFAVVLQGVTRQSASGDWSPRLSQGFLRFSPDGSFVVRAGRIGYDAYLLAESRQVGYSYTAVRPSPDFYGLITSDEIDGLDVAYTLRVGRGLFKARVYGGDNSGEIAFADRTHSELDASIEGATFDYLLGGWTTRVAVFRYSFEADDSLPLLAGALRATNFPGAIAVADDIDSDVFESRALQLGVAYDNGPTVAQLVYTEISSDSIAAPDVRKLYAQFGYRVREWTPYAAYANSRDRHDVHDAGLPNFPMLAPLNAAVVAIQKGSRSTQRTASLGVRYDFNSHVDFKFQADRTHVADSSLMFDYRPDAGSPFDMTVFTAAVDFVF